MIPIKIIGAVLIFLSSVFIGTEAGTYESLKYKESEAFLGLIRHIRNEISCYMTPIPKIISSYSSKELSKCGFIGSFEISWNEALGASYKELHIDNETLELLQHFGEALGGPDPDEQISCCDYYAEKLSQKVSLMKEELPEKKKMYRTVSLVLGALAVIILM